MTIYDFRYQFIYLYVSGMHKIIKEIARKNRSFSKGYNIFKEGMFIARKGNYFNDCINASENSFATNVGKLQYAKQIE